jgi:hypothetical protein
MGENALRMLYLTLRLIRLAWALLSRVAANHSGE